MELGFLILVIASAVAVLFVLAFIILVVYLIAKNSKEKQVQENRDVTADTYIKKTLAETLKEVRIQCKMTQEYVAETLGVSRQAVSKWKIGASEPTTANLIELSKLYNIDINELIGNATK